MYRYMKMCVCDYMCTCTYVHVHVCIVVAYMYRIISVYVYILLQKWCYSMMTIGCENHSFCTSIQLHCKSGTQEEQLLVHLDTMFSQFPTQNG